jgi:hypothetical protein
VASQIARSTAEVAQSIAQMHAAAKQAEENGASHKVVRSMRKQAERLVSSVGRMGATSTVRPSTAGSDAMTSCNEEQEQG